MEKRVLVLFLVFIMSCVLSGCQSNSSGSSNSADSSNSWAYEFVVYDGKQYGPSNQSVSKNEVGKQIGVVERNIEDFDTNNQNFKVENFDSNSLKRGTPLYEDSKDSNAIVYKLDENFYLAKRISHH